MSVELVLWQGVAVVLDLHEGAGKDRQEQIDLCAVLADRRRLVAGGRLVVTPTPHLRQVVLKALSEIRTVVGLPRLRRKQREHALLGIERLPLDRDVPDPRERAGRDVEDQDRASADRPRPPAARRERSPSCSRGLDRALRGSRRHQARGRLAASRQSGWTATREAFLQTRRARLETPLATRRAWARADIEGRRRCPRALRRAEPVRIARGSGSARWSPARQPSRAAARRGFPAARRARPRSSACPRRRS